MLFPSRHSRTHTYTTSFEISLIKSKFTNQAIQPKISSTQAPLNMFLLCFLMAATQIIKSQLINKQAQQILEDRKVNIKRTGRCAPEGQHSSSCAGSLQHCSVTPNNHNLSPGNLNASLTPGSIKANLLLCNFNLTESATTTNILWSGIILIFSPACASV